MAQTLKDSFTVVWEYMSAVGCVLSIPESWGLTVVKCAFDPISYEVLLGSWVL